MQPCQLLRLRKGSDQGLSVCVLSRCVLEISRKVDRVESALAWSYSGVDRSARARRSSGAVAACGGDGRPHVGQDMGLGARLREGVGEVRE